MGAALRHRPFHRHRQDGIPALGILLAPLFAEVLPARISTGALLPLLITADAFAVIFWRRHGSWKMRYIMGAIVIVMLGVHVYREYILARDAPIPTSTG